MAVAVDAPGMGAKPSGIAMVTDVSKRTRMVHEKIMCARQTPETNQTQDFKCQWCLLEFCELRNVILIHASMKSIIRNISE